MNEFLFPEDEATSKAKALWEERSKTFGTPEFRQRYARYIQSARWKKLAAAIRLRARGRCEKCGRFPGKPLHVHHLTYIRFEHEMLEDLLGVCKGCHDDLDEKRQRETRQKSSDAYDDAAEDNWKSNYLRKALGDGDDWQDRYYSDPERYDQQFEDYRERKRAEELGY